MPILACLSFPIPVSIFFTPGSGVPSYYLLYLKPSKNQVRVSLVALYIDWLRFHDGTEQ